MPANIPAQGKYNSLITGGMISLRGVCRLPDSRGNYLDYLKGRPLATQYEWDAAYWYGTLVKGMPGPWKNDFLRRMWTIIWFGGLWRKNREGQWRPWAETDMPIATCLSHGGRVLVELPNNADLGARIWQWLWAGHAPQTRWAATHGVKEEGCLSLPGGTLKHLRETGGASGGHHFGVNIASGGYGNRDPMTGNTIVDNGKFGHLYVYYLSPTGGTYGALLFGAEDSAPIDRAYPHFFVRGQTGHLHTFGDSGAYSLTGGEKFKKLSMTSDAVPTGNDSMFVNPSWEAWQRFLNGQDIFDVADLGHSPPLPGFSSAVVVIPQVKEFQKATYLRRGHIRHDDLRNMDKQLEVFHSTPNLQKQIDALGTFISLGELYMKWHSESASLKAVVDGYVQGARSFQQKLKAPRAA